MTNDNPSTIVRPSISTTADWHQRPDPMLQSLSDIASASQIGVTLFLPWGIATGVTLSGEQFFTRAAESARRDNPDDAGAENFVSNLIEPVAARYAEEWDDEDYVRDGHRLTSFIHLRDVVCLINGQQFQQDTLRVQLSHVTAWHYGKLAL